MVQKVRHVWWHYLVVVVMVFFKSLAGEILWCLVGLGGYLLWVKVPTLYGVIFGLPLLFIGGGFVLNALWSQWLSVFSVGYNRGMCPFCS
jgi:hypothetical protein